MSPPIGWGDAGGGIGWAIGGAAMRHKPSEEDTDELRPEDMPPRVRLGLTKGLPKEGA